MELNQPCHWFFWGSFVALGYTFVGYPIVIGTLARLFPRPINKSKPVVWPHVSVVIVAYNEAARIRDRIENLFAADYPEERLRVIVVTDGSDDGTSQLLKDLKHPRLDLIERAARSGKSACVNAGIAHADSELVVLCDARQRFESETIRELVQNFSDDRVGAVSGELLIEGASTSIGGGVDLYWRLEKFIRAAESRFRSVIGVTGAVYAIRRELFVPIPEDTLLDDVVIPMQIVLRGYRVGFDADARAYDPQMTDPAREKRRKLRTLAGNYQMFFRYPGWMMPWRTALWWQLISHKYSRILAPFLMIIQLVSNVILHEQPGYRQLLIAHAGFYLLALLGTLMSGFKVRLISVPAGFVFLNMMVMGGFWNFLRGSYRQGKW